MLCKVALRLQPINEGKYGASWSHGYCCPAIIRGCSVNSEQCSHIKLTKFGLFWRQSGPSSISCYSSLLWAMTSAPFGRYVSESWPFCRIAPARGGHLQTPALQMQLQRRLFKISLFATFRVKADGFVALQWRGKEGAIVDGCISNAPSNLQPSFCQNCTSLTYLLKPTWIEFSFRFFATWQGLAGFRRPRKTLRAFVEHVTKNISWKAGWLLLKALQKPDDFR